MVGECKELIHPLDKKSYPVMISFSLKFSSDYMWIDKREFFY
jgi:hypothetical protein